MGVKFSELPAATTESVANDDYIAVLDSSETVLKKTTASHASPNTAFGPGTTTAYGHNKIIDNLESSTLISGESLAAHQGNVLARGMGSMESGLTAAYPHAIGEYFVWQGQFVKVVKPIAVGDAIDIGENVSGTNISSMLSELNSNSSDIGPLEQRVENLDEKVTDLDKSVNGNPENPDDKGLSGKVDELEKVIGSTIPIEGISSFVTNVKVFNVKSNQEITILPDLGANVKIDWLNRTLQFSNNLAFPVINTVPSYFTDYMIDSESKKRFINYILDDTKIGTKFDNNTTISQVKEILDIKRINNKELVPLMFIYGNYFELENQLEVLISNTANLYFAYSTTEADAKNKKYINFNQLSGNTRSVVYYDEVDDKTYICYDVTNATTGGGFGGTFYIIGYGIDTLNYSKKVVPSELEQRVNLLSDTIETLMTDIIPNM